VGSNDNLPARRSGKGLSRVFQSETRDLEEALKRQRFEEYAQLVKTRDAMQATIDLGVEASLKHVDLYERLNAIEAKIQDPVLRDQVRNFNNYLKFDGANDLDKLVRIGKTNITELAGRPP